MLTARADRDGVRLARVFWLRLLATCRWRLSEQQLEEELQNHLEHLRAAEMAKGATAEAAAQAARREFGSVEAAKELYREHARFRALEAIARDVNFALRQARRNPVFTATAVISLALGIGANVALFSFVNALLPRHLDIPDASRRVCINTHPYRIIGVLPQGFRGANLQRPTDIFLPVTRLVDFLPAFSGVPNFDWRKRLYFFLTFARLEPGATALAASSEVSRINKEYLGTAGRADRKAQLQAADGSRGVDGGSRLGRPTTILLAIAGVVLLIACANLATLLVSRTSARSPEFATKAGDRSFQKADYHAGADREQRACNLGDVVPGVLLAYLIVRVLLFYLNRGVPAVQQLLVAPDASALAFAVALGAVSRSGRQTYRLSHQRTSWHPDILARRIRSARLSRERGHSSAWSRISAIKVSATTTRTRLTRLQANCLLRVKRSSRGSTVMPTISPSHPRDHPAAGAEHADPFGIDHHDGVGGRIADRCCEAHGERGGRNNGFRYRSGKYRGGGWIEPTQEPVVRDQQAR